MDLCQRCTVRTLFWAWSTSLRAHPNLVRPIRARLLGGFTGQNLGGQFDLAGGARWGNSTCCWAPPENTKTVADCDCPISHLPLCFRRTWEVVALHSDSNESPWCSRAGSATARRIEDIWWRAPMSLAFKGGDFAHWAQLSHQESRGRARNHGRAWAIPPEPGWLASHHQDTRPGHAEHVLPGRCAPA